MILSPRTVELLADRIARAYCRRSADVPPLLVDARIWSTAAAALLTEHRQHPWVPLDPELFVVSQRRHFRVFDPAADLATPRAVQRYRRHVERMIRKLRRELRAEIGRAERRLKGGDAIESLLVGEQRWLSALSRYILAYRAGRDDLVERWRGPARHQHEACPLYRRACRKFLPDDAYPVLDSIAGYTLTRRHGPLPAYCPN